MQAEQSVPAQFRQRTLVSQPSTVALLKNPRQRKDRNNGCKLYQIHPSRCRTRRRNRFCLRCGGVKQLECSYWNWLRRFSLGTWRIYFNAASSWAPSARQIPRSALSPRLHASSRNQKSLAKGDESTAQSPRKWKADRGRRIRVRPSREGRVQAQQQQMPGVEDPRPVMGSDDPSA